jgi:hypothetical protein
MNHTSQENRITWSASNPNVQNVSKNDPDKQTDGFYLKHHHYQQLKDNLVISRAFTSETEFIFRELPSRIMLSDHYGVEMTLIKQ